MAFYIGLVKPFSLAMFGSNNLSPGLWVFIVGWEDITISFRLFRLDAFYMFLMAALALVLGLLQWGSPASSQFIWLRPSELEGVSGRHSKEVQLQPISSNALIRSGMIS